MFNSTKKTKEAVKDLSIYELVQFIADRTAKIEELNKSMHLTTSLDDRKKQIERGMEVAKYAEEISIAAERLQRIGKGFATANSKILIKEVMEVKSV